ncbi:nascent polypeptide-associated complex subunit alpha, muscle-specific form-like [Prinia subflava]|uniref:nascent polypeptide-associated complex subunit alpha, muscle-specific form-like n=1 Tax=Prinia subflava TaxID=208062 RepID=UPI002FE1850D
MLCLGTLLGHLLPLGTILAATAAASVLAVPALPQGWGRQRDNSTLGLSHTHTLAALGPPPSSAAASPGSGRCRRSRARTRAPPMAPLLPHGPPGGGPGPALLPALPNQRRTTTTDATISQSHTASPGLCTRPSLGPRSPRPPGCVRGKAEMRNSPGTGPGPRRHRAANTNKVLRTSRPAFPSAACSLPPAPSKAVSSPSPNSEHQCMALISPKKRKMKPNPSEVWPPTYPGGSASPLFTPREQLWDWGGRVGLGGHRGSPAPGGPLGLGSFPLPTPVISQDPPLSQWTLSHLNVPGLPHAPRSPHSLLPPSPTPPKRCIAKTPKFQISNTA